jgi:4-methyl-5(b-hydroxyethyl)-thiazole monophosphate biosynthesis
MANKQINKSVLILLAEGFELMETSCFTDVLAWASFQDGINIKLTTSSSTGTVKTAFGGFNVTTDSTIAQLSLDSFDALAIPGGMEWAGFFENALSEEFLKVVKHFIAHNKPIAAVCVASTYIANSREFAGREATIYHSPTGKHKAKLESMGVKFVDKPVVEDDNIITSTGPGTAVEVALALLGKLTDISTVKATRHMMRIPHPSKDWYQPQVE